MTRYDVPLCSWNSPPPLAGNTGLYLSRSVYAKQSGWLNNLWTDAGRCVFLYKYLSAIPAAVTSDLKQHMTKRHRRSSWSAEKAIGYMQAWGKKTSLWTSAKLKSALFRANTLHNRLFLKPPTVYQGKHVVSRDFHRSHLEANEVSKSEGTKKVKYAYHFLKVCWWCWPKIINYWSMPVEATAGQSWRFFETQCT